MFELTGKLVYVGPEEQITERFRKRVIHVEMRSGKDGEYTETIPMELVNRAVDKVDDAMLGSTISAKFDLRGRKYTDRKTGEERAFLSLSVWSVTVEGGHAREQAPDCRAPRESWTGDETPAPGSAKTPSEEPDGIPF